MSSETRLSSDLGGTKHDFAPTYDRVWPHAYLKAHLALDYVIPHNAKTVFNQVIANCMRDRQKERLKIIDVGCSYGINAALLKCDLALDELYAAALPGGALYKRNIDAHRVFFDKSIHRDDLVIVGVDPARRAIGYAKTVGLIDAAVTSDLERHDPSEQDVELLRGADLIISTGCVGYVTERTFDRLYRVVSQSRPRVACFVMHPFPYGRIAETLDAYGLQTREIETWRQRQRRFSTSGERRSIVSSMKQLDMDSRLERTTGYVYASFHLSLPLDMTLGREHVGTTS
jgi:hypothetical protein